LLGSSLLSGLLHSHLRSLGGSYIGGGSGGGFCGGNFSGFGGSGFGGDNRGFRGGYFSKYGYHWHIKTP
jgi:hypothetical protein